MRNMKTRALFLREAHIGEKKELASGASFIGEVS